MKLNKRSLIIALTVVLMSLVLDQASKSWALSNLGGACAKPGSCIDLIFGAKLHLVFNNGAAFSQGESLGRVFGIIAFIMTFVLLYLASQRSDKIFPLLYGLIAGGAIGNLWDRAFRAEDKGWLNGSVVDFIDLGWWPVFNLADAFIVIGAICLLVFTQIKPDISKTI